MSIWGSLGPHPGPLDPLPSRDGYGRPDPTSPPGMVDVATASRAWGDLIRLYVEECGGRWAAAAYLAPDEARALVALLTLALDHVERDGGE